MPPRGAIAAAVIQAGPKEPLVAYAAPSLLPAASHCATLRAALVNCWPSWPWGNRCAASEMDLSCIDILRHGLMAPDPSERHPTASVGTRTQLRASKDLQAIARSYRLHAHALHGQAADLLRDADAAWDVVHAVFLRILHTRSPDRSCPPGISSGQSATKRFRNCDGSVGLT